MNTKKIKCFRVFVVSDDSYLFLGVKTLIEDMSTFRGSICTTIRTGKLLESVASSKEKSYDIVISDNYFHQYLISLGSVRNTIILPAHYDLDTYRECFNNLPSVRSGAQYNPLQRLSQRENLLFTFFSAGIHDDSIAEILQISKKTISAHRRNILAKLNLKNRNELYIYALATKDN